jgi:hypothetical protein
MEQLISCKRATYARLPISDGRFPGRPGLPVMVLQVQEKKGYSISADRPLK